MFILYANYWEWYFLLKGQKLSEDNQCHKIYFTQLHLSTWVQCILHEWLTGLHACGIGWSDFHFFAIFKNGHIAIDWLYFFYEFNSKKSAAQQNFHFQKITGTLKINIFLSWREPSSYIKDQSPKIEFKIRACLVFFLFFKNGENCFWPKK